MANADILMEQIARARAGGGAPKLTVHFAGESEEEFDLNDWKPTKSADLPAPDYVVLVLEKNDGSQIVVILMANVTFYRVEF